MRYEPIKNKYLHPFSEVLCVQVCRCSTTAHYNRSLLIHENPWTDLNYSKQHDSHVWFCCPPVKCFPGDANQHLALKRRPSDGLLWWRHDSVKRRRETKRNKRRPWDANKTRQHLDGEHAQDHQETQQDTPLLLVSPRQHNMMSALSQQTHRLLEKSSVKDRKGVFSEKAILCVTT